MTASPTQPPPLRQPLLVHVIMHGGSDDGDDDGSHPPDAIMEVPLLPLSPPSKRHGARTPALAAELRAVLLLALPTVVTTAAQQLVIVTSQLFSGRIGTDKAAAAALGNTIWNFAWYLVLGFATALDTLGSQAVGCGDKAGLRKWMAAGVLVLSLLTLPMMAVLWHAGPLAAVLFGQAPEVSLLVSRYCRWLTPGLLPMALAQLLQKYLQTQGLVGAPALTSGLAIAANVAATWAGCTLLGLDGVALAATATRVLLLLSMLVAVAVVEAAPQWQQQQWACAEQGGGGGGGAWRAWLAAARDAASRATLGAFLALAVPGGLMLGFEAASFEVTTVFAGALGPASVAAHAGLFSVTSLCYLALPFALATASTMRVGSLLGARQPRRAAASGRIAIALGTAFMAACGVAIFAARRRLGLLFGADEAVVRAVAAIAPLGAAYQVGDGMLGTSQGVLRGVGRQGQLMLLNTLAFWCVGVPTGWWLTFRQAAGLQGLWVGMATGCFLAAAGSLVLVLRLDWHKEVEQLQQAGAHGVKSSDSSSAGKQADECSVLDGSTDGALAGGGAAVLALAV